MSSLKSVAKTLTAYALVSASVWLGLLPALTAIAQDGYTPPVSGTPDTREGGGTRLAQDGYTPPVEGIPGRREGGGTRGDCLQTSEPLVALMPQDAYGETVSGYPSFYFFVPAISVEMAEFQLLNEAGDTVYTSEFQVTGESGIVAIHLPETVGMPPLAVGENYEWVFSLVCDRNDRSGDLFVSGWLQRIEPSQAFLDELAITPESDRSSLYARSGLWYEAIDTLVENRLARPSQPELTEKWTLLLESVGLSDLADAPFLPLVAVETFPETTVTP